MSDPDEQKLGLGLTTRLLALQLVDGKKQVDQIRLLSKAGLTPKQIAELLETSSNTVSVTLSQIRRKGRRGAES